MDALNSLFGGTNRNRTDVQESAKSARPLAQVRRHDVDNISKGRSAA